MRIPDFALERYFAEHEFSVPYLLSSSDCDGLALSELLSWADPETKGLWEKLTLGYGESQGLPLLRREIASLYEGVSPEEVLVAAPQELVLIAMNCLVESGDHVVATFPGYQSLYQVAETIGAKVDRWTPVEEEGWRFRLDDLLPLLKKETKLLVVNFPHNPTGSTLSPNDWKRLHAICAERGIRLFADEMYRWLERDAKDRLPSACEASPTAVALSGMSKTFGLAGLRVGWLVTKDADARRRFAAWKDYTTICGAAPAELLAVMGLRARDRIVRRHLGRIERNLGLLRAFFSERERLFSWVEPKAGTIGFAGLKGEDPEAFCARVRRDAKVLLLPSTVYSWPSPHVRIGFGRENMPDALSRLSAVL